MPPVLDVTNPTARKPHTCDLCGAPITPGEKYERQRCVYDGHMYAWLTCVPCQEVAHQAWEYYADTIDYDEGLGTETTDEWAHVPVTAVHWDGLGQVVELGPWSLSVADARILALSLTTLADLIDVDGPQALIHTKNQKEN